MCAIVQRCRFETFQHSLNLAGLGVVPGALSRCVSQMILNSLPIFSLVQQGSGRSAVTQLVRHHLLEPQVGQSPVPILQQLGIRLEEHGIVDGAASHVLVEHPTEPARMIQKEGIVEALSLRRVELFLGRNGDRVVLQTRVEVSRLRRRGKMPSSDPSGFAGARAR